MKLVVQIPCYNEEKTLPLVLKSIPKQIAGVDKLEILIIDDGSSDKTVAIAKKMGVNHIIRHTGNKGLAVAFANGLNEALRQGADIIVNTDADNQYPQKDIPRLIQPIIKKQADIVIADRQTGQISHFSRKKKFLQWLGSQVVRKLSQSNVPDAVSGFRAYSREAALQINVVSEFSYVIESIIHAQSKRLAIASVKVKTNPPTRNSRLFKNMFQHIYRSTVTMVRIYMMYRPLKVFSTVGMMICAVGLIPAFRFVYFFYRGESDGHIQSLIFSAILIMVGFQIAMGGLLADLMAINRKLAESTLNRIKEIELNKTMYRVNRNINRQKDKVIIRLPKKQGYVNVLRRHD